MSEIRTEARFDRSIKHRTEVEWERKTPIFEFLRLHPSNKVFESETLCVGTGFHQKTYPPRCGFSLRINDRLHGSNLGIHAHNERRSRQMACFTPVTFKTSCGSKFMIRNIRDMSDAMRRSWPDKDCESYLRAVELIKRSQDGECSPRAAFGAFMEAASKQDRIVRNRHRFPKEVASTLADITKFVAS
ncbi:DUF982 domain-containing protein [Mesorhizobium amorphae]|uniref:DUF982 domain-containing protein n=3 Tax=Mesorhizobium TaxID=68287 RepID=UPI0011849A07|nr:DUF982 domain-containing protein [Mesorhizobium amorphae]